MNGLKLDQIKAVKTFEEDLRNMIFYELGKFEEEIRSIIAYVFDYVNHKENLNWWEISAYNEKKKLPEILKNISKINYEVSVSRNQYVNHYLHNHKVTPMWVVTKVIKFKTLIDLLDFMKDESINTLCKLYGIESKHVLKSTLNWIRIVRNACVHNERIYDISINGQRVISKYFESKKFSTGYRTEKNYKLVDLIMFLKYYLTADEYRYFINNIVILFERLRIEIPEHPFEYIRAGSGIRDLNDLYKMLEDEKNIDYEHIDGLFI